jgi:hypothetical protein
MRSILSLPTLQILEFSNDHELAAYRKANTSKLDLGRLIHATSSPGATVRVFAQMGIETESLDAAHKLTMDQLQARFLYQKKLKADYYQRKKVL